MWSNFERSRFARMTPLMVEQPFSLYIGEGLSVEGRIDAIFEREDGVWEVVDYKTGATPPDPLQLALYARAVRDIWMREAAPVWLLLRDGREQTAPPTENLDELLSDAAIRLREPAV
jgi:RecB family exonuclease